MCQGGEQEGEEADLWYAFDFRSVVRIVVVDCESEFERSSLVHACSHWSLAENSGSGSEEMIFLPSSGVMVSSKLSKSSGLGKLVFIVEGRSSSVRSVRIRWNAEMEAQGSVSKVICEENMC